MTGVTPFSGPSDNVIYLADRRPVVTDDVTPEAYDQLLALVDDDHETADAIIECGWRPTTEGGAA